jgi:hypothetical protein
MIAEIMKLKILTFLLLLAISPVFSAPTDPVLNSHQKEIISYFKEIALGFEYGSASGVTRKWKAPMKIFFTGNPSENVLKELTVVVDELNELATDGFHIEIVNTKEESNFHLFFGSRPDFASLYPADEETIKSSSGIFRIFWNKSNFITRGYAFIHDKASEKEQRHAIREELTQALGLGKDSPLYPESIFQARWTIPTEFLEIDREVIRYLYHPAMRTGLTGHEVEAVLTHIFISENSNL